MSLPAIIRNEVDPAAMTKVTHRHDFGVYYTLGLSVDAGAARRDMRVSAYTEAVREGLATWTEACFAASVRYADGEQPIAERDTIGEIVTGALLATRRGPDGHFAAPDFETLHRNLAAAYPASAKAANTLLQEISA